MISDNVTALSNLHFTRCIEVLIKFSAKGWLTCTKSLDNRFKTLCSVLASINARRRSITGLQAQATQMHKWSYLSLGDENYNNGSYWKWLTMQIFLIRQLALVFPRRDLAKTRGDIIEDLAYNGQNKNSPYNMNIH